MNPYTNENGYPQFGHKCDLEIMADRERAERFGEPSPMELAAVAARLRKRREMEKENPNHDRP